jgi:hypothetical protein
MPYQTGTANGPADLLDKLRIFAEARGWTTNRNDLGTTGELCLAKGAQFVNFDCDADDIFARGSTGFDGGLAWNAQPGHSSVDAQSNNMPGPFAAYHFFAGANPDYVYAVVETVAGIYKHLVFGQLVKTGAYTGGAFVDTVYWEYSPTYVNTASAPFHAYLFDAEVHSSYQLNGQIRADIDGFTNRWYRFYLNEDSLQARGNGRGGLTDSLFKRNPNSYNALTVLLPIYVMVYRPGGTYSPIGTVPDLRQVNIANLAPGATISIGGQDWMIFPAVQKRGAAGTPNSGDYGYAYRLVP